MTKKDLIIESAIKYFNQKGFGAATLYQLAKEIGISRGNLTYHFKDKNELIETIVKGLWEKLETGTASSRQFPSFENLQNEIKTFQKIQKKYAFVFFDSQLLLHPKVKNQLIKVRRKRIQHYMAIIDFSIQIGNMKKEVIPGTYHNLCRILWMISFYWLTQKTYAGTSKESSWDKMMWTMLLPHFTEKGKKAFKDYFGETYYQSLGKAFEASLKGKRKI